MPDFRIKEEETDYIEFWLEDRNQNTGNPKQSVALMCSKPGGTDLCLLVIMKDGTIHLNDSVPLFLEKYGFQVDKTTNWVVLGPAT